MVRAGCVVYGAGALLFAGLSAAGTEAPGLDDTEALRISQAAIGRSLDGYRLTTSDGQTLALEKLRGRPVVLSLIYTSCYHVCSGLTVRLRDTVKVAREALGTRSFSVVTLGFDVRSDTPQRMRQYALDRGVNLPEWYFASADAATVARLVRDVGFTYHESPKGFDHITQVTIIDQSGRVALQVYGENFAPPLLVEPLKKLVLGASLGPDPMRSLVSRVKLFCTIYDPTSGRYRFDYSLIVEIFAGALALGLAAIGILASLRNVR